ncbi:MAG TPA: response regulator transcription factor [Chloroflexi bacterium]|nr:MAG: DNA-binding response regulator [Chloroflexota bacterium]HDN04506.1 response regulator transcription factor [Chloroflexota bacterium]
MYKILICDDQKIVCQGLQTIINADPILEVIGIAHNGADALAMIPATSPDLVLMDLKMPVMNGVLATRKISDSFPDVYVLVLTTYDDDEWIFDAIRSGAAGYLLKDTPPADLIKSIKGTLEGKSFIDPQVAGKLLSEYAENFGKSQPPTHYTFTERERDILTLLSQGLSNTEISEKLFLAEGTVRNYTSVLLKKLGVSDRTQAAILAIRYGLVADHE